MYEAIGQNISGSTVRTAISFYGKKYSFAQVMRRIDVLADNLAAEFAFYNEIAVNDFTDFSYFIFAQLMNATL